MNLFDVHNWVEINNKLYFKAFLGVSGTFYYDLGKNKLCVLSNDKNNYMQAKPSFFRTLKSGKKAIFLPYWFGHEIEIYDTESNNMDYLKVVGTNYRSGIVYGNKIFAISEQIDTDEGILVMDLKENKIFYPYDTHDLSVNMFGNGCINNNWYYINSQEKDTILRVDLERYVVEKLVLPKLGITYGTVMIINDKCYLTGDSNCLVIWDFHENIETIGLPESIKVNYMIPWKQFFSDVIKVDNKLYFAPLSFQAVVSFDIQSSELKIVYKNSRVNTLSWGIKRYDHLLHITLVDTKNNVQEECQIDIDTDEVIHNNIYDVSLYPKLDISNETMSEYSSYALKLFMEKI